MSGQALKKATMTHDAGMYVGRMVVLACILPIAIVGKAFSQGDWAQRKCDLYSEGWAWVLQTQDLVGVGRVFIDRHQAFVDANCDHAISTCPVTEGERHLADLLTTISMNEGMASTFVPFACKAEDRDFPRLPG